MKAHVEIEINLPMPDGKTLHDVLSAFATISPGWVFSKEQSEDYQSHHDSGAAGFAICNSVPGTERASVAIACVDKKQPRSFRVTNIVPADTFHLDIDQYNAIGVKFAAAFRKFLRENKTPGRLTLCGPEKSIAEIIPGLKCRQFFESWLHTPTPTSHPSDVDQLDRFTCALFRYQSKVNLYEVERYLIENRKRSPKEAAWAVHRIQTGLDVLRVNRRF